MTDRHSLTISGNADPVDAVADKIRLAIDAGADWIQIREKDLPSGRLLGLTCQAVASTRQITSGTRTQIFVNDRFDVALAAREDGLPGVAGVHLGAESVPVERVVSWCRAGNAPQDFQVGVSCHSVEQAREAERGGANYVFFGPCFDTPSKRRFGPPQGLDRLGEICRAIQVPVIAIGGIDESNAEDCIRAGASGIAAIRLFQESANADELRAFILTVQGSRAIT